jgi:transposase
VQESTPAAQSLPGHGWTVKKVRQWVEQTFGCRPSRSTLRCLLRAACLRWKKCKKVLRKANATRRAAYMAHFQHLFERMCQGEVSVVYVDESHFHQDLDMGYTWAMAGRAVWRESVSPPLSARINWYGAYDFTRGQAFLWHEGKCNSEHTEQFLLRLHDWQSEAGHTPDRHTVIIWDGAPWHRSMRVRTLAQQLGIELIQLPAYSPDLNPIEGLWKWMRTEVTQHLCHASLRALFLDCTAFIERINQNPQAMIQRLWPRFELDPDYEKLLLSM